MEKMKNSSDKEKIIEIEKRIRRKKDDILECAIKDETIGKLKEELSDLENLEKALIAKSKKSKSQISLIIIGSIILLIIILFLIPLSNFVFQSYKISFSAKTNNIQLFFKQIKGKTQNQILDQKIQIQFDSTKLSKFEMSIFNYTDSIPIPIYPFESSNKDTNKVVQINEVNINLPDSLTCFIDNGDSRLTFNQKSNASINEIFNNITKNVVMIPYDSLTDSIMNNTGAGNSSHFYRLRPQLLKGYNFKLFEFIEMQPLKQIIFKNLNIRCDGSDTIKYPNTIRDIHFVLNHTSKDFYIKKSDNLKLEISKIEVCSINFIDGYYKIEFEGEVKKISTSANEDPNNYQNEFPTIPEYLFLFLQDNPFWAWVLSFLGLCLRLFWQFFK